MRRGLAMLAFCASTLAFAPVHRQPSMSTLGASMNVNDIVDKAYEGKSFAELAASPVSALQGMADWTDAVGADLKIPTVGQLGRWKYFLWARAFADLAEHEMPDRRVDGSTLNANKALDEAHEGKTIKEILALPPSALQGIAEHSDADLAKFKVRTVADLGAWKFAIAASAIATLAEVESGDLGEHR